MKEAIDEKLSICDKNDPDYVEPKPEWDILFEKQLTSPRNVKPNELLHLLSFSNASNFEKI